MLKLCYKTSVSMQHTCSSAFALPFRRARLPQGRACHRRGPHTKRPVQAQAKKKGGGKKKGPGSLMDAPKAAEPYLEAQTIMQNLLMVESYKRKVGRPIMEDAEISQVAKLLWDAPYAVLSQDMEEEPIKFDYANKAALDLLEAKWEDLVGQPSTIFTDSAGQEAEDHEDLQQHVTEHGTASVHSVWRTGMKGRKFCISNGILWNIETPTEKLIGQAIAIHEWEFEDGTRGGPIAEANAVDSRQESASPSAASSEMEQAELGVKQQANHVRHLKEVEGLTKDDPVLDAAVSELLQRKQALQNLQ